MFDHRLRPHLSVALLAIAIATLVAPAVQAQRRQGNLFNDNLFNIGGAGARGGSDPETRGSVGCGGAWGDALTDLLNDKLNQNVSGENALLPLGQRRELWRFCDSMTNAGGGWDVDTFVTLDQEQQQNEGYAPAEMFGQSDVAQSIAGWQMTAVANRVQQVRTTMRGLPTSESYGLARDGGEGRVSAVASAAPPSLFPPMNFAEMDRERQRASSPGLIANLMSEGVSTQGNTFGIEGLGAFMSGRYVRLEGDTTSRELGSNTDGGGFTLGMDYRIGSRGLVGVGFGYNHYKTKFSRGGGKSDIDDIAGLVFGSYFVTDSLYVDATLRGSGIKTDNEKRTPTLDGGPDFAKQKSDPDGWTISSDVGVGMDFPYKSVVFNPYGRLGVYHTKIDGFTESGGDDSLSLVIGKQEVTSLPLTLGASVVHAISTRYGVVAPYLRIQYLHEFLDQAAEVKGFLKVIPEASFTIKPNKIDRDYGTIGFGASMTFQKGWSGYADYDALIGFRALDSHTLTFGLRKEL
jgi:outer membrane autotransporter protein